MSNKIINELAGGFSDCADIIAKYKQSGTGGEITLGPSFFKKFNPSVIWFFSKVESQSKPSDDKIKDDAISTLIKDGYCSSAEKPGHASMKIGWCGQIAAGDDSNWYYILTTTKASVLQYWNKEVNFVDSTGKKIKTKTPPPSKKQANPNPKNISMTTANGYNKVEMVLGDIGIYADVASIIFKAMQERIDFFDIQFDRPFSAEEYALKIKFLNTQIRGLLPDNADNKKKIKLIFTPDFKSLEQLWLYNGSNYKKIYERTGDETSKFSDQTYNSLVFNLIRIYNKYNQSFQYHHASSRVFISEDEVRTFMNRYLVPKFSVVTSNLTRGILDKFVLGDARLIDDEFYEAYKVSREDIPFAFKANLTQQVSQQYEYIGDFLGDKWLQGAFKEITSPEDLYEDLLNYISIPDLIKLSARCLLKMIPLKELLDSICQPVLDEYDKHKEAIIQELESMDDGIAKNLAQELKELYFSTIDEGLDFVGQIASEGVANYSGDLWDLTFGYSNSQWNNKSKLVNLITDNKNSIRTKTNLLIKDNNSIGMKLAGVEKQIKDLESERDKISSKLLVFNNVNPPEHLTSNQKYYDDEIVKLGLRKQKLEAVYKNLIKQIRLHNSLYAYNFHQLIKELKLDSSAKALLGHFWDELGDVETDKSKSIIPHLINLDPYITEEDKTSLFDTMKLAKPTPTASIKILADIKFPIAPVTLNDNTYGEGFEFIFGGYSGSQKGKKDIFDLNLTKNVKDIFKAIEALNDPSSDGAPPSVLKSLANFGQKTTQSALDEIFADDTKRYQLCLAIYSSSLAAGYLIYQLIDDPAAVGDYFADQGKAIYKGLKRRLEIFSRTDYPVVDILAELGESLLQIGINLGRDLLINGIMLVLNGLNELCSDEDKVNPPYNPIGAVDLSSFMKDSKTDPSTSSPAGNIENTDSFKQIYSISPDITGEQFSTILASLSESFTIKETCGLLSGNISDEVYLKAISVLEKLDFLKDTKFYDFYVGAGLFGIKKFFKLISRDIEPAFCAQALANFEKEKSALLEICFGRDDSVLESMLCEDLTPEECLQLLATKANVPSALVGKLVAGMGSLFTDNTLPDPCSDISGSGIFDDSQKFGADKIGDSTFGAIEKSFEADISKIKDIYSDTFITLQNNPFFTNYSNNPMKKVVHAALVGTGEEKESLKNGAINDYTPNKDFVATKILNEVAKSTFGLDPKTNWQAVYSGDEISKIGYVYTLDTVSGEHLEFSFDPTKDIEKTTNWNTSLEVYKFPEQSKEDDKVKDILVSKRTINFNDYKRQTEEDGIITTTVRPPDNILFRLESDGKPGVFPFPGLISPGIAVLQPGYNTSLGTNIGGYAMANRHYKRLMDSILRDLLATSFKEGLYNKSVFNNLNLNKSISLEQCFLGFMNKRVLNKQMQQLAEKLTCFNPEDPAVGPVNIAMIKFSLDCVVRIIAIKELMKSLFVYGIFPTELATDNQYSFYDDLIIAEIERSIPKMIGSRFSGTSYENFYNEVVKAFITDIMKVLYQDNTIEHQEAFKRLISVQVNFAKQQMKNTISGSNPNLAGSITKPSEYQLIESALKPKDGNNDPYQSYENINMLDKVQALQNDYFTFFNDTYNTPGTDPTSVEFSKDEPLIPLYVRKSQNTPINYFDHKTLHLTSSTSLKDVLQKNDEGIVFEKMIEIDYNSSLLSQKDKDKLRSFFSAIGNSLIMTSNDVKPIAPNDVEVPPDIFGNFHFHPRRLVKRMLYETKLIMFFPQLKSIVDSFDEDEGIWKSHLDEKNGNFNLFRQMFDYNFNTMNNNVYAVQDVLNTIDNMIRPEFQEDLDWAFTGKFFINDLEDLINNLAYPFWVDGKEYNQNPALFDLPHKKDFGSTLEEQIKKRYSKEMFDTAQHWKKYIVNTSLHSLYIWTHIMYAPGKKPSYPEDWDFPEDAPEPDDIIEWYNKVDTYQNVIGINALTEDSWLDGSDENFFQWLMSTPLNNVLKIKPVLRLSSYIKREENPNKELELPQKSLFGSATKIETKQTLDHHKELIENKIGNYIFTSEDGDSDTYFGMPLFSSQKEIPDTITWLDMFMKINKDVAIDIDGFYNSFSNSQNKKLNDLLFSTENVEGAQKDIFNFMHAFNAITPFSIEQQKKIFVYKYKSTQWFNIRNRSVSKEMILEHVALGLDVAKHTSLDGILAGAGFVKFDFVKEEYDNNPYAYLTPESLASLTEDAEFFIDPETNEYRHDIPSHTYAAGGFSTMYNDSDASVYWAKSIPLIKDSLKCKVGEWDIVSPTTGDIIVEKADKFISIRASYENSEGVFRWIDYGWFMFPKGGEAANHFNKIYPGAAFETNASDYAPKWFDPHLSHAPMPPSKHMNHDDLSAALKNGFRAGFCQGGLVSPEKTLEALDIDTDSSAYIVFANMLDDANKQTLIDLLKVFFIKEQTTMVAVINKLLAEKYYPQIETNFNSTLYLAFESLLAAVASANNDWQHTSEVNSTAAAGDSTGGLDLGAISGQILKMFFGAMANTVDPTWKTEWFAPGPFTPFGIVAKLLDEYGDVFKGDIKTSGQTKDPALPPYCDDAYDNQVKALNEIIKNEK